MGYYHHCCMPRMVCRPAPRCCPRVPVKEIVVRVKECKHKHHHHHHDDDRHEHEERRARFFDAALAGAVELR